MSRRLPSLRLPEGTELIPFIVLSIVIFAAINPAFVKPANLLTILSSLAFVGVIAVGQTVVIIGGQIDLSVGANAALSAVVSAKLMVAGVPIVLSLLAGVGVGIVVGLANGLLSMTGIPSFIVTIGTLYIVGGVAVFVTHGQPIFPLPPAITAFGTAKVGPFTASFLAMIALFLVLDEPSTGVDPVSRIDLWRLVSQAAAAGAAVLMSTTYLDEAERAARLVVLDRGRVLAQGTWDEVRESFSGTVTSGQAASRPEWSWRRGHEVHEYWAPGQPAVGAVIEPDLEDVVIALSLTRRVEVA